MSRIFRFIVSQHLSIFRKDSILQIKQFNEEFPEVNKTKKATII